MAKKETAHRASQKHMKYVKTRDGRRVLNTAYVGPKRGAATVPVSAPTGVESSLEDDIVRVRKLVDELDDLDMTDRVKAGRLRVSDAEIHAQKEVERLGARIAEAADDRMRDDLGDEEYRRVVSERDRVASELAAAWDERTAIGKDIDARRARLHIDFPERGEARDKEVADINSLISKFNTMVKSSNKECDTLEYTVAFRNAAKSVVGESTRTGGRITPVGEDTSTRWDQVRKYSEFVPSAWIDRAPLLHIQKSTARATAGTYSDQRRAGVGIIKITSRAHESTMIHEMGHMFENNNPKLANLSYAYIANNGEPKARRTGRRSKSVQGQISFKSGSDNPAANDRYTYVVYPRTGSTEVMATGLETVLGGGTRSAFRNDKLTHHVLGTMAAAG